MPGEKRGTGTKTLKRILNDVLTEWGSPTGTVAYTWSLRIAPDRGWAMQVSCVDGHGVNILAGLMGLVHHADMVFEN